MVFPRDLIRSNSQLFRVLAIRQESDLVWVFPIEEKNPLPRQLAMSLLLKELAAGHASIECAPPSSASGECSDAASARRNRNWSWIEPLVKTDDIFYPKQRSLMIDSRAAVCGTSRQTLWAILRAYWAGGMNKQALFPRYHKRGRSQNGTTGRRGRPPAYGEVYQLTDADTPALKNAFDFYVRDEFTNYQQAYQFMVQRHYCGIDGHGKPAIYSKEGRPSLAQMKRYFKRNMGEAALRKKKGTKRFDQTMRPVLGRTEQVCLGVGHVYEIDCTIADIYVVAEHDCRQVIGKPTICLIKDRYSRLVVGWYIGFERPSWDCVRTAVLSLVQDKQDICKHYGLEYDALDWPASTLLPEEFVADRGEGACKESDALAEVLGVRVTNLPAQRPDHKPGIECQFRLMSEAIAEAPGYEPSGNVQRRRGKHYEYDACLNLKEFSRIVLQSIIKHNRTPLTTYPSMPSELWRDQLPIPREIWARNIVNRVGALRRMHASDVYMGLLSTDDASITHKGILFNGLYYLCDEAMERNWYLSARGGRRAVEVRFDRRSVNEIVVIDPDSRESILRAKLSPANAQQYSGLSFAELRELQKKRTELVPQIMQTRLQQQAELNQVIKQTADAASQQARAAGVKKGSSRKSNAKTNRMAALAGERQEATAREMSAATRSPTDENGLMAPANPPTNTPSRSREISATAARVLQRKAAR